MSAPWTQHPGFHIREEMEARGWSEGDLAAKIGRPEVEARELLAGTREVTGDLAQSLARAFDVPARFFLNLQKAYNRSRDSATARSA